MVEETADLRDELANRGPVVGKVKLSKDTLMMAYACAITNLPFLVTLAKVKLG